jgi:hypothetical protein
MLAGSENDSEEAEGQGDINATRFIATHQNFTVIHPVLWVLMKKWKNSNSRHVRNV